MNHQLKQADVERIVKGASVERPPSLLSIVAWFIGAGLFLWLFFAWAPGCIERDNGDFQRRNTGKEQPHIPARTEGLNTIINYGR